MYRMAFNFKQFLKTVGTVAVEVAANSGNPVAEAIAPFAAHAISSAEIFGQAKDKTGTDKLAFARDQMRTALTALNNASVAAGHGMIVSVDEALATFDSQVSAIVHGTNVRVRAAVADSANAPQ